MGRHRSAYVAFLIGSVLIACAGGAAPAGNGGLADERIVLPAGDAAIRAVLRQRAPLAFRLSPDATRVLLVRPTEPNPRGPADAAESGRLILREIDTGKETPVPANLPPGMANVHVRFNFFDPAGKHLVAIDSLVNAPEGQRVRIVLCDVATGNVVPTEAAGPMLMGRFDQTGKRVLVSTQVETSVGDVPALKELKKLSLPGFIQSVCPTADVACAIVPPTKEAMAAARAIGQRPQHGLVLFDYAADKPVAQLPIHPRNSALDDVETQWTSDGRYLFYVDYDDPPRGGGPPVRGTRVWDRAQSKPIGFIPLAMPVGPGPSPTTMVLNGTDDRQGRAAALFDAAKGAAIPLGDGTTDVVHAAGGFILYLKGVREQTELRVARIVAGQAVSLR